MDNSETPNSKALPRAGTYDELFERVHDLAKKKNPVLLSLYKQVYNLDTESDQTSLSYRIKRALMSDDE